MATKATAASSAAAWPAELSGSSRRLSRAHTVHAALSALGLLHGGDGGTDCQLRVHLLGADQREGTDPARTAEVFAPLCALLAGTRWREVELLQHAQLIERIQQGQCRHRRQRAGGAVHHHRRLSITHRKEYPS